MYNFLIDLLYLYIILTKTPTPKASKPVCFNEK